MADIENQTLAYFPMKNEYEVKIVFCDDWHTTVSRMWGRDKVERHMFRIRDGKGGLTWFECTPQLAKSILGRIDRVVENYKIDVDKLEDVSILVLRGDGGKFSALIRPEEIKKLPKIKLRIRIWDWVKKRLGK